MIWRSCAAVAACAARTGRASEQQGEALHARRATLLVEHPELGQAPLLGFPTRMSESSVEITRAPYLGEHSDDVLREDLDLGKDELASLREAGILG